MDIFFLQYMIDLDRSMLDSDVLLLRCLQVVSGNQFIDYSALLDVLYLSGNVVPGGKPQGPGLQLDLSRSTKSFHDKVTAAEACFGLFWGD